MHSTHAVQPNVFELRQLYTLKKRNPELCIKWCVKSTVNVHNTWPMLYLMMGTKYARLKLAFEVFTLGYTV